MLCIKLDRICLTFFCMFLCLSILSDLKRSQSTCEVDSYTFLNPRIVSDIWWRLSLIELSHPQLVRSYVKMIRNIFYAADLIRSCSIWCLTFSPVFYQSVELASALHIWTWELKFDTDDQLKYVYMILFVSI